MAKVLIAPMTLAGVDADFLRVLHNGGHTTAFPPAAHQLTEAELMGMLQGFDACLAGSEPYTRKVIAANPQLKIIARVGVGYDAVDCAAATDHGVVVTITPNTNHEAVAELTFALILALAKSIVPQHLNTRAGKWVRQTQLPLRGQTLGIVGLGRIGKAVALRARAFGMRLIAYEPFVDEAFIHSCGVTVLPLELVFAQADFLTLHIPMTAESKHLINKKTLSWMKKSAYLINTARGGLVCEADLCEALQAGQIAGAGLDVFEQEPPGQIPLMECDNVVLAPHIAGMDFRSRDDMAQSAAEAVVDLLAGNWPVDKVVNPDVKAKFRAAMGHSD